MLNYDETIDFLKNQSSILSDKVIDNMILLTAHIYDKEIYEVYRDMEKHG